MFSKFSLCTTYPRTPWCNPEFTSGFTAPSLSQRTARFNPEVATDFAPRVILQGGWTQVWVLAEVQRRTPQGRPLTDTGVDFVAGDRLLAKAELALDVAELFFQRQGRLQIEETQALAGAGRPFQALGIVDAPAQHLETAAEADDFAPIAQVAKDRRLPALLAQPGQVAADAFGAGQDDEVGRGEVLAWPDEGQCHLGVQAQGVEVGAVTEAGQGRDDNPEAGRSRVLGVGDLALGRGRQAVLRLQVQTGQKGEDAEHRLAGFPFQPLQAGPEEVQVTAEAVDDEALDPGALALTQQGQGAHQVGEDAAPVDVGDQDDRAIHGLGETHVGDILGTEVDLGGGAGAFDQDHLVPRGQAVEGGQDGLPGLGLVTLVVTGVHGGDGAALDDDLGAGVRVGLEQHRVHVRVGLEPAGQGLDRLGTADLAAVVGDGTVQGHVLGLEGGNG